MKKNVDLKFPIQILDRLVSPFFPDPIKRRSLFNLGLTGWNILLESGPGAFLRSFLHCYYENFQPEKYRKWIRSNEPTQEELGHLTEISRTFSYRPKISIVTPVWETDERWLRCAIESIIKQTYENWELCLVDGGSEKKYIQQVLKEYAAADHRIRVKSLPENKGIACNSNEALSLATGDFIGFLDHDDELAPFALHEVIKMLNTQNNAQFVYSDEDKIDAKGNRKHPFFKPEWSPDLFLSQNYICHFCVINKTLLDSTGGFRGGYEGSQDYDLFLRCIESIPEEAIVHIPKILYHWRISRKSVASTTVTKPYALNSATHALEDTIVRRALNAQVLEGIYPSTYRIRYVIVDHPRISILIPTKDHVEVLQRCIQSIIDKTEYDNYEILIIDNKSEKPETWTYYTSLKENSKINILHYPLPFNFSAINNFAADHTDSPFIVFLNNDTEVISGEWLSAMLEHAQRHDVGAVGAKLLYPNNLIQHAGIVLGIQGDRDYKGVAGHSHKYISNRLPGHFFRPHVIGNYSAVTAACLMMRKEIFVEIGGFEEELAIAYNDVDLCLKIRQKGYRIVYTPYALLHHHESYSRGLEDTPEKQARFSRDTIRIRNSWGQVIDSGDPYYNPNLTLEKEDFSMKI